MTTLQLTNYYRIWGEIHLLSGLHIGAGSDVIEIGGNDNPVIVHPLKRYPYIPGSSLKGKMRSLLELRHAAFDTSGEPSKTQRGTTGFVGRIFGISAGGEKDSLPTALIMRDAEPTEAYMAEITARRQAGQTVLESKSENTINRIDSSANPRTMERVPSGASFGFEAIYRIFAVDGSDAQSRADFARFLEAMALLQNDTLGGSGSRGYGRIEFHALRCEDMAGESVPIQELRRYLVGSS